jgi:hypothetical protein
MMGYDASSNTSSIMGYDASSNTSSMMMERAAQLLGRKHGTLFVDADVNDVFYVRAGISNDAI